MTLDHVRRVQRTQRTQRVGLASVVASMVCVAAVVAAAPAAEAAFPGADGVIVYTGPSTSWMCFQHGHWHGGQALFAEEHGVFGPTQLTCPSGTDQHPSVSPDGSEVVYAASHGSGPTQLAMLPVPAAPPQHGLPNPTPVSDDPTAADDFPSWSPTGDGVIVFVRTLPGAMSQLWTENVADPSGAAPVFASPTGYRDSEPVFDPSDPDLLVFVRWMGGHSQIFSYDLSTHVLSDLSLQGDGGTAADDAKPDFDPVSGGPIVFESDRACGSMQLYTMTLQGTDQEPVFGTTHGPGPLQSCPFSAADPAYSPQGDALVFDQITGTRSWSADVGSWTQGQGQGQGLGTQVQVDEVPVGSSGSADGPVVRLTRQGGDDQPNWGPAQAPPGQTPEVSMPVVLPVVGAGLATSVMVLRRRRSVRRPRREVASL